MEYVTIREAFQLALPSCGAGACRPFVTASLHVVQTRIHDGKGKIHVFVAYILRHGLLDAESHSNKTCDDGGRLNDHAEWSSLNDSRILYHRGRPLSVSGDELDEPRLSKSAAFQFEIGGSSSAPGGIKPHTWHQSQDGGSPS